MRTSKLQIALARQSRIRRSRDIGWMLFTTAVLAAMFGWSLTAAYLAARATASGLLALLFAAGMTFIAFRLFKAGTALNRRLKDAEKLTDLPSEPAPVSLWSEVFPPRR